MGILSFRNSLENVIIAQWNGSMMAMIWKKKHNIFIIRLVVLSWNVIIVFYSKSHANVYLQTVALKLTQTVHSHRVHAESLEKTEEGRSTRWSSRPLAERAWRKLNSLRCTKVAGHKHIDTVTDHTNINCTSTFNPTSYSHVSVDCSHTWIIMLTLTKRTNMLKLNYTHINYTHYTLPITRFIR